MLCCGLDPAMRVVVMGILGKGFGAGQGQLLPMTGSGYLVKLQSDLKLVAAYAGSSGMWERPHCH